MATAQVDSAELKYTPVLEDLYGYRFQQAHSKIELLTKSDTSNPVKFLKIYEAWWHLISGYKDEARWNRQYKYQVGAIITAVEASSSLKSLDDTVNLIYAHLFEARLNFFLKEYFTGLSNLNKGIDLIEATKNRYYQDERLKLIHGLYNYFHAKGQEKLLLKPLLATYPSGDLELGLKLVKSCTNSKNVFLKIEANYFLMKIYQEHEANPKMAAVYNSRLRDLEPNNVLYAFYKLQIAQYISTESEFEQQKASFIRSINKRVSLPVQIVKHYTTLVSELEFEGES
jgi:hypothetical protein